MHARGFLLFATPIGACALAWRDEGIAAAWLPEGSEGALRAHVQRRLPGAREAAAGQAPRAVQEAAARIVGLLHGEGDDLRDVALDYTGLPQFHQRVYELSRAIPPGRTRTYGELALALGEPGAARAVGQALGRNPLPILVPCHRVLAAGGKAGGFSAPGGVITKHRLLQIEGAIERDLF